MAIEKLQVGDIIQTELPALVTTLRIDGMYMTGGYANQIDGKHFQVWFEITSFYQPAKEDILNPPDSRKINAVAGTVAGWLDPEMGDWKKLEGADAESYRAPNT